MSYTIDLSSHGRQLKSLYDSIVSSDPSVAWAVFNYEGQSSVLKPGNHGSIDGDYLQDFVDEFEDGKVQYGFVRVVYQNLPKFVLVGWVGEGVPERTKGYFNAHYATVAKYFHGYHVQITARSSNDLSPAIITAKVDTASGSKYGATSTRAIPLRPKYAASTSGASEEDWGNAPPVHEREGLNAVQSAYQPTKVDIAAIKNKPRAASPKPHVSTSTATTTTKPVSSFTDVKSSYEPIGKVDIAAIRAQAKNSQFANTRAEPLQSSYKPVGKVDIAQIRAQAAKAEAARQPSASPKPERSLPPQPKDEPKVASRDVDEEDDRPKSLKERMAAFSHGSPAAVAQVGGGDEDESPKSVKDRMNVFQGSGRLSQLPKPKVENKVGARFAPASAGGPGRGTAPSVPKSVFSQAESKAAPGFKDYGSQGGKTPAQVWAEKHGKVAPSPAFTREEELNPEEEQAFEREEEEQKEKEDFKNVRNKFAQVGLNGARADEEEPSEEPESSTSFADITSRFAKPEPGPPAPVLPSRETAPSLPSREAAPGIPSRDSATHEIPQIHEPPRVVPAPPEETEGVPPEGLGAGADAGKRESIQAALDEGGPKDSRPEVANRGQPVKGLVAVVAYDYEKDEENEISMFEGEVITEIEQVDEDWWQGKNSRGETGLFPSNYVELTDIEPGHEQHITEIEETAHHIEEENKEGPSAVAVYDYEAKDDDELSFPQGAIISNIDFVDEAWWCGTYEDQRGLLPSNYVELQE